MGRIRTVKPELFKHEELFDLEKETGLPVRLAFIGLFTCCDRQGRFKWRTRALKLDVLPFDDDVDFSHVLDALTTRGFVQKYVVSGVEFGVIPSFSRHQVINNRESDSEIPPPTEESILKPLLTREPRVDDATPTRLVQDQGEGKGKEGKGKEGDREAILIDEGEKPTTVTTKPATRSQGSRLPLGWQPSFENVEYARKTRPDLDPQDIVENFRDYWTAKSGKDGTKVDWDATWRMWVRNEKSRPAAQTGGTVTANTAWWASASAMEAKARTLGLNSRPGESLVEFKGRIENEIRKQQGSVRA